MNGTALNRVEQLAPDLWMITETDSVHCYLLLGQKKALLFDIGYGYKDIHPLIRQITDLPVMLVISHGDPDHGLGANHFPDVWLHPLDYGKLLCNDTEDLRRRAYEYRVKKAPQFKPHIDAETFLHTRISEHTRPHFLREGDRIDLGGKQLEVIHTPGHSYGHIMLLEQQTGRLFAGDQLTEHNIWYFLSPDEQAPFADAVNSMKKLLRRREEITTVLSAHGKVPIDMSYAQDLLDCLSEDLPRNYRQDTPFPSFMGDGWQHFYKTVNLIYSDARLAEWMGQPVRR